MLVWLPNIIEAHFFIFVMLYAQFLHRFWDWAIILLMLRIHQVRFLFILYPLCLPDLS